MRQYPTSKAAAGAQRSPAAELKFSERYGSWALIAGASEGLGAAFARAFTKHGVNVIMAARRKEPLELLAQELRDTTSMEVRCYEGDLASGPFLDKLHKECHDLDLGIVVCNAAQSPIGDFVTRDVNDLERVVDVNIRAPLLLLRGLLPDMVTRGRGAAILMTSMTGHVGTPRIAAYAASKAFLLVLGESLWYELKDKGVDVLACSCGPVRTPGYTGAAGKEAPGTLDADKVVKRALWELGSGPVATPGLINSLATQVFKRLLPRRTGIAILARTTRTLAAVRDTKAAE
jgi:short-subunit dehydrogenase